eukprot:6187050-Pleurochrysis_carterae.AAC.4
MLEKRTAAGLVQQEMRKAKLTPQRACALRCEAQHRARAHRRAAACPALLRLEADGRGQPAGPAQEAQAPGQDLLRARPSFFKLLC